MGCSRHKLVVSATLLLGVSLVATAQTNSNPEPLVGDMAPAEFRQLILEANGFWERRDYTNALPLYERILATSESTWGKDNPELAKQLILIGTIHSALGEP